MILQTDVILNAYFRQMEPSGCATLLPFWSANKYNRAYVDRGLIVSKINKWIDLGWITHEFYINNWSMIHLDLGLQVAYHGHAPADTVIMGAQYGYGYWRVDDRYYHFTALTDDKRVSYDPLGTFVTPENSTLENIRLFTRL